MNEVSRPGTFGPAVATVPTAPHLPLPPQGFKARILGGLIMVLPVLITLWVVGWLFFALRSYVIDPLAMLVLWTIRKGRFSSDLPDWFEIYAAPPIAILLALLLLYVLGFFVHSRLRRGFDAILLRVPIISTVYDGVQKIFQTLDKQRTNQGPQRVVLIEFPHPGMKVPGFVTATCRDIETQKTLLCIYVPTTPVPTSGYFLLVPEEDVTELNWTSEQALQTIVSGGLTVPPEVRYYKSAPKKNLEPSAMTE
ncbi:hypothetical protein ETAA8_69170 [Anatilimnocola aggregata]|uniref:DUF502 domain-containing protein n=1 Tax=Anatilimnocola aggregata TaxID=2528021 RepID=A0A517YNF2_9BACT|nr:DUF502 domain-containing protein [Anatilimnocola aggregata]QDU31757.1 hypothetical protein ETAA8_69170 [Anatilimnocola aggregata]